MFQTSDKTDEFFKALAAFQDECEDPKKDSFNPHFKSKYVSLGTVIDTVRPVLKRHGLVVNQHPVQAEGGVGILTHLHHLPSNQWVRSSFSLPLPKNDAQAVGSGITYGLRYSLLAILGLAAEDDDGNEVSGRGEKKEAPRGTAPLAQPQASGSRDTGGRVASAEQRTDQRTTTATSAGPSATSNDESVTQQQITQIQGLYAQLGVTQKPGMAELAKRFAGVSSASELTFATAKKLIAGLTHELATKKGGK